MPVDGAALGALVSLVDGFYITHRRMKGAQARVKALLQRGDVPEEEVRRYVAAVNEYFKSFEHEIRDHLRSLDGRLAKAYQVQFNLTTEREVAVKRMEATRAVMTAASQLGDRAR